MNRGKARLAAETINSSLETGGGREGGDGQGPTPCLKQARASEAVRRHRVRTKTLLGGKQRVYSEQNLNYNRKTNLLRNTGLERTPTKTYS